MSWLALLLLVPGGDVSIEFDTQIIPVLTRSGCNAGACHGAAAGRGGFRLSLLGSNPSSDYLSIARELEGRRINVVRPAESLLLRKPSGMLEHGGDYVLEYEGSGYQLIRNWISQGAVRNRNRSVVSVACQPEQAVLSKSDRQLFLRATARFSDGAEQDVTAWTVFSAVDPAAVEISSTGQATVRRGGQHVVIARFLNYVLPITLILPLGSQDLKLEKQPRHNLIDDHVLKKLASLQLPVSPPCDDAAFLRRVTLDLTGRLPDPQRVQDFLQENSPDKRAKLVDRLLASKEFTEYWTWWFARLLRIRSSPGDDPGPRVFHAWLAKQIAQARPLNHLARELLVAQGDSHEYGPANFYRLATGPRQQAEYVSEVLCGVRLRCANCHDHPLDRWTQDDYHGLAAMFARVDRGRHVRLRSSGEVTHPRTGQPARLRIPGERFLNAPTGEEDPREELADWLTSPKNAYFARAWVNRLWKELMGRGLVEATDDLRSTNPPTHPRLLDALADDFTRHGYDFRHTLRLIASSAAYARGRKVSGINQRDDRFYSRASAKPLAAEVLADAIVDVTGVPEKYGQQPLGTRAISLVDSNLKSRTLEVLGRCDRNESCESSSGAAAEGLTARLHLMNGALLNQKIADPQGALHAMLRNGASNEAIVGAFYLRALGREPTAAERTYWQETLAGLKGKQRAETLEDFLWSLLSNREFWTSG